MRTHLAAVQDAIRCAVDAAQAQDADDFAQATATLLLFDPVLVGTLQATIVRSLCEQLYPSGLAGDDVRELFTECLAAAWFDRPDAAHLIAVMTGALHLQDAEENIGTIELTRHANLVTATLLTRLSDSGDVSIVPYLVTAIAELERAQTMELP